MKQHKSIWRAAALLPAVLPFVFALLFASCDNPIKPDSGALPGTETVSTVEAGKANVSFSISGGIARTVLPDVSEVNLGEFTYKLTGTRGENEEQFETTEISESGTTLAFTLGKWSFTLSAHGEYGSVYFTDDVEITLEPDKTNEVVFALKPLKEEYGNIDISFEFPADAGITSVKSGGDIPGYIDFDPESGTASYQSEAAAGDRFATFLFYREAELAAVVSETIQVRKGLTSKKTITLSPENIKPVKPLASGWNPGSLVAGGNEWFVFTASAESRYIHARFSTLSNLYVQVYDSAWQPVGSSSNLSRYGKTFWKLPDLSDGQTYYIKIWNYYISGDYEIAFNESIMIPGTSSTALVDGWNPGSLAEGKDEWFSFTANAGSRYMYAKFGTLSNLYAQVYDSAWQPVGSSLDLSSARDLSGLSLSDDQLYYIKVWSTNSGDYHIMVSEYPVPATEIKDLTGWTSGNISAGGEEWFALTAVAANQFLHAKFGVLTDLSVQVYDSAGQPLGSGSDLSGSTNVKSLSGLNAEQTYYIKVWPTNSGDSGDYEIMVNGIETEPEAAVIKDIASASGWNSSSIAAGGEEWFKFTAVVEIQSVHVKLNNLDVNVYNSAWQLVGGNSNLSGGIMSKYLSGLSVGQTYYINVRPSSGNSGNYEMALSETLLAPGITPIVLTTGGAWIFTSFDQWFAFPAHHESHFINARFRSGSPTSISVEVYNSSWQSVGRATLMNLDGMRSWYFYNLDKDQTNYFRVSPNSGGQYEIEVGDIGAQ